MLTITAENATVKSLLTLVATEMKAANQQGRYVAYIEEFGVTKENLKEHAEALAALVTEPGAQNDSNGKRTKYGVVLNTIKTGLKRNLPKENAPETDWLKLVRQATENAAVKGAIDADQIVNAVLDALGIES